MSELVSEIQRHKKFKRMLLINIVQELCESRGGRPGLPSLISLVVSVDVKQHFNFNHAENVTLFATEKGRERVSLPKSKDIKSSKGALRSCVKVVVDVLGFRP